MGEKRDPHIIAAAEGLQEPQGGGPEGKARDIVLLSIPSKPEYVGLSRLAVAGLARVSELPEETVADLKLAVTEACTYALQHVEEGADACLEVVFRITPGDWEIEVAWHSDSSRRGVPLADGGLGLAVMRALVDDVDVEYSPDGRALLRLTKQL